MKAKQSIPSTNLTHPQEKKENEEKKTLIALLQKSSAFIQQHPYSSTVSGNVASSATLNNDIIQSIFNAFRLTVNVSLDRAFCLMHTDCQSPLLGNRGHARKTQAWKGFTRPQILELSEKGRGTKWRTKRSIS
jgi:hypothetical protein